MKVNYEKVMENSLENRLVDEMNLPLSEGVGRGCQRVTKVSCLLY